MPTKRDSMAFFGIPRSKSTLKLKPTPRNRLTKSISRFFTGKPDHAEKPRSNWDELRALGVSEAYFQPPVNWFLIQKYRVPHMNKYFVNRLDEIGFLKAVNYSQYLAIKEFLKEISTKEGLDSWSKTNTADQFLRVALEPVKWWGLKSLFKVPAILEDDRRESLVEFVYRYGKLIKKIGKCPVDPDAIKEEEERQAREAKLCISQCLPFVRR
ncbi:hypothetical protein TWF730_008581 [Orbilia blumenaviensis]|uniref:Uncharacterized protein n=1 Tax=Orbilia blumenaviensis TaxID=1796055 RepID=A0AAV9V333_9PEZI